VVAQSISAAPRAAERTDVSARQSRYTIGRNRRCDVVIADASVSGLHAELELLPDGQFFLTDCKSTNGTALLGNGGVRKVRQQHVSAADRLKLGDVELEVAQILKAVGLAPDSGAAARPSAPAFGASSTAWVRGKRLIRCGNCGAVMAPEQGCPACGR
jgi:pSer/pThr/pTyr-binding forkhead associated (FHA) protein